MTSQFKYFRVLKDFHVPSVREGKPSIMYAGDYLINDLRDDIDVVVIDPIRTRNVGLHRGYTIFSGEHLLPLLSDKSIEEIELSE